MGDVGSIVGVGQRGKLISQQEELLEFKRSEDKRKRELPRCPDCKSFVEKDSKLCAKCGLQIVTIKLPSLSSRYYAFSRKTIKEDLALKVNELKSQQSKRSSQLELNAAELGNKLKNYLRLISADKSLQNDILKYGDEIYERSLGERALEAQGHGCLVVFLWAAISVCGPLLIIAFGNILKMIFGDALPNPLREPGSAQANLLIGTVLFGPALAAMIYLAVYFDPLDVKSKRRAVVRINKRLQKLNSDNMRFSDIVKDLKSVFKNLSTAWANSSQVEKDKKRCLKLANSFSLNIEKPQADPIYLGLENVTRILPKPSQWMVVFPKLSVVLNELTEWDDNATIQKKNSIQGDAHTDSFYIKLLNGKIIGPYKKNQIKDGIAKNKIPAGCFFSKSENGPWKALKIS